MNYFTIRLILTITFIVFLIYFYFNDQDNIKLLPNFPHSLLHKYSPFKSPKTCETLSWMVELELQDEVWEEDEMQMLAEQVATEVGLRSSGFIGVKNRHYHFTHPSLKHQQCYPLLRKGIGNLEAMRRWSQEKHTILSLLRKHSFIKSFEQQYGSVRRLRSVGSVRRLRSVGRLKEDLIDAFKSPFQTGSSGSSQSQSSSSSSKVNKKANENQGNGKMFENGAEAWAAPSPGHNAESSKSVPCLANHDHSKSEKTIQATNLSNHEILYNEILKKIKNSNNKQENRNNDHDNRHNNNNTKRYMGSNNNNKQLTFNNVSKRSLKDLNAAFNDPFFSKQWHLVNIERPGWDLNISAVWMMGVNGTGVNVAIIDDGLDWGSRDIAGNYNKQGSINLHSNQPDPKPSPAKASNNHGTRCAGEISGVANNSFCGVGVAYGSTVSGIRLIDAPITDALEARAFNAMMHLNHIYSCSWGPEDDGATLDGPGKMASHALREGTEYGRHGYGSIFVVASGNGGRKKDNCNYDGYANSAFTMTIGGVDEFAQMPQYGEECASMLAVAYSSGTLQGRDIVTADWGSEFGGTGCTQHHSGTSAAAPLAAGLVALMLQVRPCLTWRDVQYIVAVTAVKIDVQASLWTENRAGLSHSHQHGFGVMDAWRMVNVAKVWPGLPWLTSYNSDIVKVDLALKRGRAVQVSIYVPKSETTLIGMATLEYAHVALKLDHVRRGDLRVLLHCPSTTPSVLAEPRPFDASTAGYDGWVFSTVRCWGEEAMGRWTLQVIDTGKGQVGGVRGRLLEWQLILYGSSMTPAQVQQRIRLVETASSGDGVLNSSHLPPCPPTPHHPHSIALIQDKYLKMLVMVGAFLCLMAAYDVIEYSCFYGSEKQKTDLMFVRCHGDPDMIPLMEISATCGGDCSCRDGGGCDRCRDGGGCDRCRDGGGCDRCRDGDGCGGSARGRNCGCDGVDCRGGCKCRCRYEGSCCRYEGSCCRYEGSCCRYEGSCCRYEGSCCRGRNDGGRAAHDDKMTPAMPDLNNANSTFTNHHSDSITSSHVLIDTNDADNI